MSKFRRFPLLAVFVLVAWPQPGRAQADYRNIDPGRPIAVEDAQPIEFRAFEFQAGIPHFSRERRGEWLVGLEQELKWGFAKNWQLGAGTEQVWHREAGRTVFAGRGTQLHALYNFNAETPRMPAFAIRPEFTIRGGGLGPQHEHGSLKLIVSKTIGSNRLHFNGSYTVGPTQMPGRGGELVNRYFYGAAYERTLPLKFMVLLADVYARKPIDHDRTEVVFEAGTRIQLNPVWVIDAAVSTGQLRPSVGPDVGFTFGISRVFSFRGLFPTKR